MSCPCYDDDETDEYEELLTDGVSEIEEDSID
jgi:hypothetical protein